MPTEIPELHKNPEAEIQTPSLTEEQLKAAAEILHKREQEKSAPDAEETISPTTEVASPTFGEDELPPTAPVTVTEKLPLSEQQIKDNLTALTSGNSAKVNKLLQQVAAGEFTPEDCGEIDPSALIGAFYRPPEQKK